MQRIQRMFDGVQHGVGDGARRGEGHVHEFVELIRQSIHNDAFSVWRCEKPPAYGAMHNPAFKLATNRQE